jgi:hypothetical protein
LTTVPSVIVSLSWGIVISEGMVSPVLREAARNSVVLTVGFTPPVLDGLQAFSLFVTRLFGKS